MNRRRFLNLLGIGAATTAVNPSALLPAPKLEALTLTRKIVAKSGGWTIIDGGLISTNSIKADFLNISVRT